MAFANEVGLQCVTALQTAPAGLARQRAEFHATIHGLVSAPAKVAAKGPRSSFIAVLRQNEQLERLPTSALPSPWTVWRSRCREGRGLH